MPPKKQKVKKNTEAKEAASPKSTRKKQMSGRESMRHLKKHLSNDEADS